MDRTVKTIVAGTAFAQKSGFPIIVRGIFTIGTGVAVVENEEDLKEALASALQFSPTHEAKVEKVEYSTENPKDSVA